MEASDTRIDGRGLERRLVACVGDAAVSELRRVLRDSDSTVALRLSVAYALRCMGLNPMP